MSTKIYEGQLVKMRIDHLYPYALAAADRMRLLQAAVFKRRVVLQAYTLIDSLRDGRKPADLSRLLGPDWRNLSPLDLSEAVWRALSKEGGGMSMEFSLCLFPDRGQTLAILYAPKEVRAPWDALSVNGTPIVEEYGYWNNVDLPDGMTASRWETRRKRWSRVLRFDEPHVWGIPSQSALTVTGDFLGGYISAEDVLDLQDDPEIHAERAKKMALLLIDHFVRHNQIGKTPKSESEILSAVMEACNDPAAFAIWKGKGAECLVKPVTKSELNKPISVWEKEFSNG